LAEVIEIHSDQIEQYGGSNGIRDINVLCSAVAMPCATFSDDFLHRGIFDPDEKLYESVMQIASGKMEKGRICSSIHNLAI
jgi:prophage maintenance system killer protein